MNLQENIQRIKQVMGVINESQHSNNLKRRVHILDSLIDNLLPNMYPCDFDNEDDFFVGVYHELRHLIEDEQYGLENLDRREMIEYIYQNKQDEIREYYRERCINEDIQENVEDKGKKDLSPMIRESLNSLIERKKHIVCDIEVTAPWNRETVETDKSFKNYKVLVTFIGGHGTKYFPATLAVNQKYDDIMDEVWHTVYDYFSEPTDVYRKNVKSCGNTIQEGLNDKWTRGEDTVTLKQLLKITKDIPVTKMSTKKLMKHALHGDNPEEMKKVDKTSLKYPVLVLVSDKGLIKYILDGHHRIQKANKHDIKMVNVKLIKFSELPKEFKKVLGEDKEEQTEGELTEKCWAGYTQKGMKTMFGKRYPNCVKKTKN